MLSTLPVCGTHRETDGLAGVGDKHQANKAGPNWPCGHSLVGSISGQDRDQQSPLPRPGWAEVHLSQLTSMT